MPRAGTLRPVIVFLACLSGAAPCFATGSGISGAFEAAAATAGGHAPGGDRDRFDFELRGILHRDGLGIAILQLPGQKQAVIAVGQRFGENYFLEATAASSILVKAGEQTHRVHLGQRSGLNSEAGKDAYRSLDSERIDRLKSEHRKPLSQISVSLRGDGLYKVDKDSLLSSVRNENYGKQGNVMFNEEGQLVLEKVHPGGVYDKLGFERYCPFLEGPATKR